MECEDERTSTSPFRLPPSHYQKQNLNNIAKSVTNAPALHSPVDMNETSYVLGNYVYEIHFYSLIFAFEFCINMNK